MTQLQNYDPKKVVEADEPEDNSGLSKGFLCKEHYSHHAMAEDEYTLGNYIEIKYKKK